MFHISNHFPIFFNKEISSLYVALGLLHFGEGLITIFVPIYFWDLGFPLWRILFFYFLNSLYFLIFAFLLLPVFRRLSDKMMMFLSIPFMILYFFGLNFLPLFPMLFFFLPIFLSLSMLLFNVGYHIDFSSVSDDKHIGREIGMRYTVTSLMQLSAPFLGGLLIAFTGFQNAFFAGIFFLVTATLPLFIFPERRNASHLRLSPVVRFLGNKKILPFTLSGVGYAAEKEVTRIVWPLFIFFAIGSIEVFGAVISIGLIAGIFVTLFAGFLTDFGRRRRVLSVSTVLFSFIWLLRPFFAAPFMVAGSHVIGNLANTSLMTAWNAQYYKIARAVRDMSTFILSREMLYHFSRIVFFPILMAIALLFSQGQFFTISFVLAGLVTLLFLFANRLRTRSISAGIRNS